MMKTPLLEVPLLKEGASKMNLPAEIGILFLRVTVSLVVIHHGVQKLQGPEGFAKGVVGKYFPFLPFPIFWTYLAAYTELVAPALLSLGIFARLAAFGLTGTMVFANSFHFMMSGLEGFPLKTTPGPAFAFEPSLLVGAICLYFVLNGPGKLSILPNLF